MLGKKSTVGSLNACKSFIHRHYLLLKAHYFFSYASLASFGPVSNITIRNRGFSNLEMSYMNVVVPFLVFFTNPLVGYIADHTRRFRLTFNVTFVLGTIFFLLMFYLPSLKTSDIQGELYRSESAEYSLTFYANKDFSRKCHLRRECGCIYQAQCTALRASNLSNEKFAKKPFHFNFTMSPEDFVTEVANLSLQHNKRPSYHFNYRVSINETIDQHFQDHCADELVNVDGSLFKGYCLKGNCELKCSESHQCDGSRYSNQMLNVVLYSFLFVLAFHFLSNSTSISISLALQTLDQSNLLGRQRLWGTIAYGLSAFFTSRLYARWKRDYVYIFTLIGTSILTIIPTSFIRLQSDPCQEYKSRDVQMSDGEEFNQICVSDQNGGLNIGEVVRLLKKMDVIIFFLTTFVWGMSFAVLDPYLYLYIDELNPCQSHSIVGYLLLIQSGVEILALLFAHKLIKRLSIEMSTVMIFLAFSIRLCGYYFIFRPYLYLPLETMHFFHFGILFVLIAEEASKIAPYGLAGTLQGVVNGVCFGLGRGFGLLVCLFLYSGIGKRRVFLIFAIINLLGGIFYLLYCLFIRPRSLSSKKTNKEKFKEEKENKRGRNANEEPFL